MTDQPPRGMTRIPDHSTSERAAKRVARVTIRSRVLKYAESEPNGFTDEDLRRLNPDAPESSLRKRRTELTEEGYILDTGVERMNTQGSMVKVWAHRKFHPAPPPITVRATSPRAAAVQLRKQRDLMFNALVMAAPHHQGGHSAVGEAIADALGIPFPITYSNIPARKPV